MSAKDLRVEIRRELEAQSTAELERLKHSGKPLDAERRLEIKRILRERYARPRRVIAVLTLIFSAVAALTGVAMLFRN